MSGSNASKAGAASSAVNIGMSHMGKPLSARSGGGVGMAPNTLLPAPIRTVNSAKGLPSGGMKLSKAGGSTGRASLPKGYKKGS